jgi:excisionase family DNA binding protein
MKDCVMSAESLQSILTVDQIAKLLGCSRRTIDRWRQDRKIPLRRLGNRWVMLKEEWAPFLKNLPMEGEA